MTYINTIRQILFTSVILYSPPKTEEIHPFITNTSNMLYVATNPEVQITEDTLLIYTIIPSRHSSAPAQQVINMTGNDKQIEVLGYFIMNMLSKESGCIQNPPNLITRFLLMRCIAILDDLDGQPVATQHMSSYTHIIMHTYYTLQLNKLSTHTSASSNARSTQYINLLFTSQHESSEFKHPTLIIHMQLANRQPHITYIEDQQTQVNWAYNILHTMCKAVTPAQAEISTVISNATALHGLLGLMMFKSMSVMEILRTTNTLTSDITSFTMHYMYIIAQIKPEIQDIVVNAILSS